jgi:glycosyltransferase involved in cell wall biosynthesis
LPRWCKRLHELRRTIANAASIPRVTLASSDREAIRKQFTERQLVVFFGFAHQEKGVEHLFEILDPNLHHLVIIGKLEDGDPYHQQILRRSEESRWYKSVTLTGFLQADAVGKILAAADAAVFPFRNGAGDWNTSLQAASMQGTFVLTTSKGKNGYVAEENTYYSSPDNITEMRQALGKYGSVKITPPPARTWKEIAISHLELYKIVASRNAIRP